MIVITHTEHKKAKRYHYQQQSIFNLFNKYIHVYKNQETQIKSAARELKEDRSSYTVSVISLYLNIKDQLNFTARKQLCT